MLEPNHLITPCCQEPMVPIDGGNVGRACVMFNPGNEVVQCHRCGTIWTPEQMLDGPLSVEDISTLVEALRSRGELGLGSAVEVRQGCDIMTREELTDIIVKYWERKQVGAH